MRTPLLVVSRALVVDGPTKAALWIGVGGRHRRMTDPIARYVPKDGILMGSRWTPIGNPDPDK
jgi:hypothetical protein